MRAEEKLIANFYNGSFIEINSGDKDYIIEIMIEFAKYHVKEALKAVDANAEVEVIDSGETLEGDMFHTYGINSRTILNAYPLENIK